MLQLVTSSHVAALSIPEHSWTSCQGRLRPSWTVESVEMKARAQGNSVTAPPVISGDSGGLRGTRSVSPVPNRVINLNQIQFLELPGAGLILWMTTF